MSQSGPDHRSSPRCSPCGSHRLARAVYVPVPASEAAREVKIGAGVGVDFLCFGPPPSCIVANIMSWLLPKLWLEVRSILAIGCARWLRTFSPVLAPPYGGKAVSESQLERTDMLTNPPYRSATNPACQTRSSVNLRAQCISASRVQLDWRLSQSCAVVFFVVITPRSRGWESGIQRTS
jgi:hypothetical protein